MHLSRAESPDDSPPLGSREHVLRILRETRSPLAVSRAEFRAAITAYVVGLRRERLPPQRVIVLVKEALREATPGRVDAAAERELTADVVRWCIEAYYDGDGA